MRMGDGGGGWGMGGKRQRFRRWLPILGALEGKSAALEATFGHFGEQKFHIKGQKFDCLQSLASC